MKFPSLAEQQCGNCRYRRPGYEVPGVWRCHRHAPQIGPRGSEWPTVAGGDWCGEWVQVEAVQ